MANDDTNARPAPEAGGISRGRNFSQTRWSLVLEAGRSEAAGATEALERLCQTYWPAIYGFLRRQGRSPHDAQDLTQGFFADLLRRDGLAAADPARGRFRSFLLRSLTNYLHDQYDKAHAQKRGGGAATISLDDESAELGYQRQLTTDATPERVFDQRWANTLLEVSLDRLRGEFAAANKGTCFDRLKTYLTTEPGPGDYESAARELSLKPGTIAVTVHRMRSRYREILCAEVADTVSDPRDVDGELRALFLAA